MHVSWSYSVCVSILPMLVNIDNIDSWMKFHASIIPVALTSSWPSSSSASTTSGSKPTTTWGSTTARKSATTWKPYSIQNKIVQLKISCTIYATTKKEMYYCMYDSIVNSITRNVHRGFSAIFCEIANSVKLNIILNMVECTFYKDFCAFSCKFQLLLMCNAATTNSSNILYTSHTSSSSSTTRSLLFHSALVCWGKVKDHHTPHVLIYQEMN